MKITNPLFLTFLCAAALTVLGCGQKEPTNLNNHNRTIVAFGDSLTNGNGVERDLAYPAVLSQILGRPVVNLGVSGDVSAQGVARLSEIDEHRPYMVLIEFGANDILRGMSLERARDNVAQMTDYVQGRGAIAVIVDTGGAFQMNRYSNLLKELAHEKNALFVPGIMDGIYTDSSLKSDNLHPNEKGYEMIANRVAKVIRPYL